MGLRAVTFDLWETLIVDDGGWGQERMQRRIAGTIAALSLGGVAADDAAVMAAYRRLFPYMSDLRAGGRDLTSDDQVRWFLDGFDSGLQDRLPANALEAVRACFTALDDDIRPMAMDGAVDTLAACRELGLAIGLISNTGVTPGRVLRRILEADGLLRYLDVLTFSDEVELAKPAPRIFLDTLARLGVTADEAVHVGDHGRWDVAGAQAAGMRTIRLWHARDEGREAVADADVMTLREIPLVLAGWLAEDDAWQLPGAAGAAGA